jgi:hypothetical protein
MLKQLFSFFGTTTGSSSLPADQTDALTLSVGINPFVGKWQSSNTIGMGLLSEVVFSADARFSTVTHYPNGPMPRMGVYRIVNDSTVWFGFVPDTHVQILPGSNGQLVAYGVRGFPQETNIYRFLDARTMVLSDSVTGMVSTTYGKVG